MADAPKTPTTPKSTRGPKREAGSAATEATTDQGKPPADAATDATTNQGKPSEDAANAAVMDASATEATTDQGKPPADAATDATTNQGKPSEDAANAAVMDASATEATTDQGKQPEDTAATDAMDDEPFNVRVRAVGNRPRRRAGMRFDHVEGTIVDVSTLSAADVAALQHDPMLNITAIKEEGE